MTALFEYEVVTPVGVLKAIAANSGLRALLWPDHPEGLVDIAAYAVERGGDQPADIADLFASLDEQLGEYFEGKRTSFDLRLDPQGTDFQQTVWSALRAIPYGETSTYGKQAASIGRPSAARAVGAANGRNPLSIVVPCHRVVGASGALTGFAGGLAAKAYLLELERGQHQLW